MVLFFSSNVQKIHAGADPIGGPLQAPILATEVTTAVASDVPQTESAIMSQIKDFALDTVAKMVASGILQTMTTEVLTWATNGFNGNPFTVENQNDHMYNIKSGEIIRLYNEVSGNANFGGFKNADSFGPLMNVVKDELRPFTERIEPTITEAEKIAFKNDFTKGGWDTYIKQADMQNNPTGSRILITDELNKRISSRQHTEEQKLLQGAGIQAATKCVGGFVSDPDTGFEYCKQEVVSTAGKLVGEQITKSLSTAMDQTRESSSSGDMSSIASTMLAGLLTDLIYKGLGSIGGSTPQAPPSAFASLESLVANDPNFQDFNNGRINAREVVDVKKELSAALDLTARDIEENLLPAIQTLSGPILHMTHALDQCMPAPDIGFEDRLRKYFRSSLNAYELEEKARTEGDSGDTKYGSIYANLNLAFGQYIGIAEDLILKKNLIPIQPYRDNPTQWREQIKEVTRHGQTLTNLQTNYNEKSKVLIRLQNIKSSIKQYAPNKILFAEDWNSLDEATQTNLFNEIINQMSVGFEWGGLSFQEKYRLAALFNEEYKSNVETPWAPNQDQIQRIIINDFLNVPVVENPTPEQKMEIVLDDGWSQWEDIMNETTANQEARINIIRNLVESRNSYTTERSYDLNRAKAEATNTAAIRLREAIFSCQKARYEIVNAEEVIPNKRTLVLPVLVPEFESDNAPQTQLPFSQKPSISLNKIEKFNDKIYIFVDYERSNTAWINYSNLNAFDHDGINKSQVVAINENQTKNGTTMIELSGVFDSATWDSNANAYTIGDGDLLIADIVDNNRIYIQLCAQNNLGTNVECSEATTQYQTPNSNFDVITQPIPEPPILEYSFTATLNGYNYFKPQSVTIPTPPGIPSPTISPAVLKVIEVEKIDPGANPNLGEEIVGIVSSAVSPSPRALLRLKDETTGQACDPGPWHFLTMGLSLIGCNAVNSAKAPVPGIPIIRPYQDWYSSQWLASRRSVALEIPFYKVEEFIQRTIDEGNPATHNFWAESAYITPTNPSGIEASAYGPIANPVIVVRNWHVDHQNNGQLVFDDYHHTVACDFKGFGMASPGANLAATVEGVYYGPHCISSNDIDSYSNWYAAKSFEYLKEIYPRLKQFVY